MLPPNYEYQSNFARKYYGQGKADGRMDGLAEGRAEGLAEGSRMALVELVSRQLSLRFGPLDDVALSRIAAASTAELNQIAERLLAAPTLDSALSVAAVPAETNTPK